MASVVVGVDLTQHGPKIAVGFPNSELENVDDINAFLGSSKIAGCIAIKRNSPYSLHAVGRDAAIRACAGDEDGCIVFRSVFKTLFRAAESDESLADLTLTSDDQSGAKVAASIVVMRFFQAIHGAVVNYLGANGVAADPMTIKWVLAVPTSVTTTLSTFLTSAATLGGLVPAGAGANIRIVDSLNSCAFDALTTLQEIGETAKFILVEGGDSTTRMAVFEGGDEDVAGSGVVLQMLTEIKDLHEVGEDIADTHFVRFIQDLFPAINIPEFIDRGYGSLHDFFAVAWSAAKRAFNDNAAAGINDPVPLSVSHLDESTVHIAIDVAVRAYNDRHIQRHRQVALGPPHPVTGAVVLLPMELVRTWYSSQTTTISNALRALLLCPEAASTKALFLAGSFGHSAALQAALRATATPYGITVHVPDDPPACAAQGAVLIGLQTHGVHFVDAEDDAFGGAAAARTHRAGAVEPDPSPLPPPKVICGIDFGTTGIAVAFTPYPPREPLEIVQIVQLAGTHSDKAPTRTALRNVYPFETLKFGHHVDALCKNGAPSNAVIFHRFKMALYTGDTISGSLENVMLDADMGEALALPAITVFARSLEFIKRIAMEEINSKGLHPTDREYRWVLTVPAIWSEAAKAFMRKAANLAGIASDQLVIALEPECAALSSYGTTFNFAGGRHMVVDAGGGTIDVTVHEVVMDRAAPFGMQIREIHKASGNDYGGVFVDNQFVRFMKELFPMDESDPNIKMALQNALYELLTEEWEEVKTTFGVNRETVESGQDCVIRIADFMMVFDEFMDYDFKAAIDAYNARHTDCCVSLNKRRALTLPSRLMHSLFAEPLRGIREHLTRLMQHPDVGTLQGILLVGGFANCYLLQQAIKEIAPPETVVVPVKPHLAVVRGAVMYGLHPNSISMRRARFTYGTRMNVRYDPSEHPEQYRSFDEHLQEWRVNELFAAFVRENDSIGADEVVEKVFYPLYADDTTVTFRMVASPMKNVRFATDPDAHVVGLASVTLDVPSDCPSEDKKCIVRMKFGATEIEVEYRTTVATKQAVIKFA